MLLITDTQKNINIKLTLESTYMTELNFKTLENQTMPIATLALKHAG